MICRHSSNQQTKQRGKCTQLPTKQEGGETMTYPNAIGHITIEQALRLYEELGICVIIDEGRHVTLIDEDYPLAEVR